MHNIDQYGTMMQSQLQYNYICDSRVGTRLPGATVSNQIASQLLNMCKAKNIFSQPSIYLDPFAWDSLGMHRWDSSSHPYGRRKSGEILRHSPNSANNSRPSHQTNCSISVTRFPPESYEESVLPAQQCRERTNSLFMYPPKCHNGFRMSLFTNDF